MDKNKKQIEFNAKNVKVFTGWLKRFSSIENSLLLEIDTQTSKFIAKTYNDEKSVVKMSSINFDGAGLLTSAPIESKRIKVGIFNIPRLIKIMDQFNDVEFNIVIEYQEITDGNEKQYAAEKILLKNKQLKMNVDCTSLGIFKYISDDLFTGTIAAVTPITTFNLSKTNIEKINNLNNLDNENKFMTYSINSGKTLVAGKSFELEIEENKSKENASISVFKEQYSNIDIENYIVTLSEDRLVFTSTDSDTVSVISRAENQD
jgi:hypothetical protein